MSQASKIKESLTKEQLDFYQRKTLSSTMKVRDWIGFLSAIAQLDKIGDSKIKNLMGFSIACFVIAFFSIFVAVGTEVFEVFIGTTLLVITGIALRIRRKKLKEQDLSNYLREFFIPLLHLLQDKAGEKTKLSAKVDFTNPRAASPEKSMVRGRDQKLYTPIYIIAQITLLDKVYLEFIVQEAIKDLNWRTTNARGKTKYKSKTKVVHMCTTRMTLPRSEYRWDGSSIPEVEITETSDAFIAKTKVKIKKIGDHVLHIRDFINSIQLIYEQFEPLNPTLEGSSASSEHDTDDSYSEVGMIAPYIWYGGYFDRYDYDSFDHTYYEEGVYEHEGESVFDS